MAVGCVSPAKLSSAAEIGRGDQRCLRWEDAPCKDGGVLMRSAPFDSHAAVLHADVTSAGDDSIA